MERLSDLVIDQGKQDRRRKSEGAFASNPLSLDAQSFSQSRADEPIFRVWIYRASSVKEGHVYFVIYVFLLSLKDLTFPPYF